MSPQEYWRANLPTPRRVIPAPACPGVKAMSSSRPEKIHRSISYFGSSGNVTFIDNDSDSDSDDSKVTVRSLVKPLVIKQWIHGGKLYRERKERVPSRFELFFDLVFVAIAHHLSDDAAEQASAVGVAQFVLTFFPTWSLWSEFRAFVNTSGTDDILQRVGILYMMALLAGYTANASAITLFLPENTETDPSVQREVVVGDVHAHGRDPALVAAVVFYLLARGFCVCLLAIYAKALPRFRAALLFATAHQVADLVIYFPLLFVTSKPIIVSLACLGVALDILLHYTVALYRLFFPNKPLPVEESKEVEGSRADVNEEDIWNHSSKNLCSYKNSANFWSEGYIPALNIAHFLERTAAFVVIVLGELVFSVVYRGTGDRAGFPHIYGGSICGLVIAFNLCWLYFDAECSRRFIHAIRRHWFSSLTFTHLHFPLCASLTVVAAAMSRMTQDPFHVSQALRWYFGGGLGCATICLGALGFTHRSLDPAGSTKLGRETQLGLRIAAGIALTCLPLSKLNTLKLLGVAAGITTFLVITETYGKLHRGEPLSKLSAVEQDVADAQNARNSERLERQDSEYIPTRESASKKE